MRKVALLPRALESTWRSFKEIMSSYLLRLSLAGGPIISGLSLAISL